MNEKFNKEITFTNIILIFVCLILFIIAFTQYTSKGELKTEIETLEKELKSEKEYNLIYEKTKQFINMSSEADHYKMLTGEAKQSYEKALDEEGKDEHNHGERTVDKIEIQNVYATKTDNDKGESYAIYRVFYGNNPDVVTPIGNQRILTLTLHTKWTKEDDEYKVYSYKIDLLKDNLDDHLKELANEEKDQEGADNE